MPKAGHCIPLQQPLSFDFQLVNNCLFSPIWNVRNNLNVMRIIFTYSILYLYNFYCLQTECKTESTALTWWFILFRNRLLTHLKQSMCAAGLHLYSPALSFAKPISWNMSSPWKAALDSTKGLNVRNIVCDRFISTFDCDFFLSFFSGTCI